MLTKVDQLIEKFKEFKEELSKNVNASYNSQPNAMTGTSGGQGGMYRAESPGANRDAMVVKFDANGQWKMEKMCGGVKKGDECTSLQSCQCSTCRQNRLKPSKKSEMGNEAKGNDENKAPGRGTLTV